MLNPRNLRRHIVYTRHIRSRVEFMYFLSPHLTSAQLPTHTRSITPFAVAIYLSFISFSTTSHSFLSLQFIKFWWFAIADWVQPRRQWIKIALFCLYTVTHSSLHTVPSRCARLRFNWHTNHWNTWIDFINLGSSHLVLIKLVNSIIPGSTALSLIIMYYDYSSSSSSSLRPLLVPRERQLAENGHLHN